MDSSGYLIDKVLNCDRNCLLRVKMSLWYNVLLLMSDIIGQGNISVHKAFIVIKNNNKLHDVTPFELPFISRHIHV